MPTCNPANITAPIPSSPSTPSIPGFGQPGAINVPNINPFPGGDGYSPEDLNSIFDTLKLLIPPGTMQPALHPNYEKDVGDAVMKLMDYLFPFLMLYKFFMPFLNIIVCIIEVICSLNNPYKVIASVRRLFNKCIPEFLNLFPVFSLVIIIISLLLLLLSFLEYLLAEVDKLVSAISRNINVLYSAFNEGNATAVASATRKIGSLLCTFQNLFVILAMYNVIIEVIKDLLKMAFSIPPCDSPSNSDTDGCCTPDVCPDIAKQPYTRVSGSLKYLGAAYQGTSLVLPDGNFSVLKRAESWQIYDPAQTLPQQFINIVDAYDVTTLPKPVFFPTDSTYSAKTNPRQAAYTVDVRLYYNPVNWGRIGEARFIRFKNCIVTNVPTDQLKLWDNSTFLETKGVLLLAGGAGYEDNGTTILKGYAADGTTAISAQATFENFIHTPTVTKSYLDTTPLLHSTDGYEFENVEYTFSPIHETLYNKSIITVGCVPDIAFSKTFVNTVIAGDVALKTQQLQSLVLPDISGTQLCLSTAIATLRSSLTQSSLAAFNSTITICLSNLKNSTVSALGNLIPIGFDACKSLMEVSPTIQFTSQPITVKAHINDKNGISLTRNIPLDVATIVAQDIKGHANFGVVSAFKYDGADAFIATITSKDAGTGHISVSYNNNIFCTNILSPDTLPVHTLQSIDYEFIDSPIGSTLPIPQIGERQSSDGPMPSRDGGGE